MRELVGGKNTIGRTAAVLKKPHKATFNLLTFYQFTFKVLSQYLDGTFWSVRVQLKRDGTWWRTGGEVKGKLAIGEGSQYSHTTSERGVSSITTADAHTLAASCRLNWRPCRFKWTRPFRRKTKSGFCACAIAFQTQSTKVLRLSETIYLLPLYPSMECRGASQPVIIIPSTHTGFTWILTMTDQKEYSQPLYTFLGCHIFLLNFV